MSMGAQKSSSDSSQDSRVWEQQAPFLQRQYQQGENLANQQRTVGQTAQGLADELMPGLQGALGTAQNVALGQDPGGQFLQQRLGADNPYLQGVIDNLGTDINQQLGRDLATIGGDAALGGARHAIERGMARESAAQQFRSGSQDLRFAGYNQQGAEAQALQQGQLRGAGAVGALTPAVQNLGLSGYNAAWMPLQQQSAILGRPTLLSSGRSSSDSFGFDVGL